MENQKVTVVSEKPLFDCPGRQICYEFNQKKKNFVKILV